MLLGVVVNNNPSLRSIERPKGGKNKQKTKTSNIRTGLDELDKTRQTDITGSHQNVHVEGKKSIFFKYLKCIPRMVPNWYSGTNLVFWYLNA